MTSDKRVPYPRVCPAYGSVTKLSNSSFPVTGVPGISFGGWKQQEPLPGHVVTAGGPNSTVVRSGRWRWPARDRRSGGSRGRAASGRSRRTGSARGRCRGTASRGPQSSGSGREGHEPLARMGRLPVAAVADAHVADDVAASSEPHAVSGLVGVRVPGHDHVPRRSQDQRFQSPCGRGRLQAPFPLVIELIVGKWFATQTRPNRSGASTSVTRKVQTMGAPGDMGAALPK